MPSRKEKLITGEYFHVFNKNIRPFKVFEDTNIALEFINTFLYYRSNRSTIKYSKFKELTLDLRKRIWDDLMQKETYKVDILSFCIMPNHYHFLLRQLDDNGIRTFMSNLVNSITRYFNIKTNRIGPIFLPQFKAKKINSIEQMVYVSKYQHVNPYAGGLIKKIDDIFNYPYSSINEFTKGNKLNINIDLIMSYFNNDINKFKNFIIKNADDQKERELLKYTVKWL